MTNTEINAEIARLEAELPLVKGTECEVWSRCVGFFRPVKDWNPGKVSEFKERVPYNVTGVHHG